MNKSGVNFNDTVKIVQARKPRVWCNIDRSISYIIQAMANFVLIFPHFCYHGNTSRLDVSFNVAVKLPDLENLLFGETVLSLSLILSELWLIFCQNSHKFSLPRQQENRKSQTVIFHACAQITHAAPTLPYLEVKALSTT